MPWSTEIFITYTQTILIFISFILLRWLRRLERQLEQQLERLDRLEQQQLQRLERLEQQLEHQAH